MEVLIVDDDPLIRAIMVQVVRRAVEDAGVSSVGDLDAAFSHIAHHRKPDLALLDLGLPGQRGMESLQRFRWKFPDVPVVVVSINEDPKAVQVALKAGASGYIPKSSTPEIMIGALKDVLAGKTYAPSGGPTGMEYRPPDPTQIEKNPEAIRYWSRTLETPEDKLKKAVDKAGPLLEDVKKELGIGGVG